MIVCLCEGVSCREIESAAQKGACSVEEVTLICSAGQGCGSCHEQILEIISLQKIVAPKEPCDISAQRSGDELSS